MNNEDKILQKLFEHDSLLVEVVTKSEFHDFKNQVYHAQDEMLTMLRRLDEERIFSAAWVKRVEAEMETHRKDIAKIKEALKIS